MRFSLGYQILVAVFLGFFFGVFLGPLCKIFRPISDIYVMLLHMAAFPYIGLALILGMGSITPHLCRKLLKRGWLFLVALWVIVFFVIYLLYLLLPAPTSVVVEATEHKGTLLAKSFMTYLVPENPFYDLVNDIVPAIVVSGLIFGIALMHLRHKEPLLAVLDRSVQIIEKILHWIALISPIGIFTHIASSVGVLDFQYIASIEFYIIAFIAASLFITFWALPAFISILTPFSYKKVLEGFKSVCLLPCLTGLPTLAIPLLISYVKKLEEKYVPEGSRFRSTLQTIMPLSYSLAQIGNCLVLFFILFLSFFFRHPFTVSEKTVLSLFMFPMSTGSATTSTTAVSFLIKQLSFPEEAVELFLETMSITIHFQVLVSVASIFTLVILILSFDYGVLKLHVKRFSMHILGMAIALFAVMATAKDTIHLKDSFQAQYMDLRIPDVIPNPVSAIVYQEDPGPRVLEDSTNVLSSILRRNVLRVGYSVFDMPNAYFNAKNELVGYDIAYAYELAKDLNCSLEFVPVNYANFEEQMKNGEFDIVMSAIIMSESRMHSMEFSNVYEESHISLVVPRLLLNQFLNLEQLIRTPNLKMSATGEIARIVQRRFPLANIDQYVDQSAAPLVNKKVDAWATILPNAFVWCLIHPEFCVIDYKEQIGKVSLAYAVPLGNIDWIFFLNNWLLLKKQSGFKTRMTRYWIQGESLTARPRRWSVIENVLHWIHEE